MEELFEEPRKIENTLDLIVSELQARYPSISYTYYPPSFIEGRFCFKLGIGDMELKELMGAAYPNAMGKSFAFIVIREPKAGLYAVEQYFYYGTTYNKTIGPGDLPQPNKRVKKVAERFAQRVEMPIGHHIVLGKTPPYTLKVPRGYWNSVVGKTNQLPELDEARILLVGNIFLYEQHARENFKPRKGK